MTAIRSLRAVLLDDHGRIETFLDSILNLLARNELAVIEQEWAPFEDVVLAHLDGEEMHVIPTFAKADPEGARRILAEHARIREGLSRLGVAFELRRVRPNDVQDLARLLVDHAMTEESYLYNWSETHIQREASSRLVRRIASTWHPFGDRRRTRRR
ncbi:hemerythrin domain-containing protein [Pendulispora brunnea]|uniref:Hemerythrin domain-containing protein n=1 Tax=Pendulispora brunnea TaxID=2905690 RepID=A0ABZ2JYY6_9BACT